MVLVFFDPFEKAIKENKLTRFYQIEQYAFKSYFSESTPLRILREQQKLLNTIRYAPFFVEVHCKPNMMPEIQPVSTFEDDEELKQFMDWYKKLPIKPWKVDSSNFLQRFIEAYVTSYNKDFFINLPDTLMWLINNKKLFSVEQLRQYVLKSENFLVRVILSEDHPEKLCFTYRKLEDMQEKLDNVSIGMAMSDASHTTFRICQFNSQAALSSFAIELDQVYKQYIHQSAFAHQTFLQSTSSSLFSEETDNAIDVLPSSSSAVYASPISQNTLNASNNPYSPPIATTNTTTTANTTASTTTASTATTQVEGTSKNNNCLVM